MATNIISNTDNGPHSINTHDHATASKEQDINQRKGKENIGHKISVNKTPVRRSSDYKDDGQDNVIRTRYGKIVKSR